MRIPGSAASQGKTWLKLAGVGLTALFLSGCSDSAQRFADNYSNPSDSDPVYSNVGSIAKAKRKLPIYKRAPVEDVSNDMADNGDVIEQTPIRAKNGSSAYDYSKDYVSTYKKRKRVPLAVQPDDNIQADDNSDYAFNAPAAPKYRAPKVKPLIVDEQIASEEEIPTYKKPKLVKKHNPLEDDVPTYVAEKPAAKPALVPVAQASASNVGEGSTYIVRKGDTIFTIGRQFNISPFIVANANGMSADKALVPGKKLRIPLKTLGMAQKKKAQDAATSEAKTAEVVPAAKPKKPAPLAVPQEEVTDQVAAAPEATPKESIAPATPAASTRLAMRWPVQGKVISGFGPKAGGLKNEGINISVPEGTNVKAAEGGVIAYAGNELKGYGNLILIRHADGYVTAYAHAAQIMVKKGETVKRGDVIAKSGQTGAVQSPQLHFEIRKGATALDPTAFLNAATASN